MTLSRIFLGKLTVVDLAEVNPDVGSCDDQKKTLDAAKKLISGWGTGLNSRRRA
jgi:arginase family enzyme